ncbi:MAG: OmpA family protein [Acidobacteria bacterium]|nr:OmpA family protein [Acidobacteriota bacterium]
MAAPVLRWMAVVVICLGLSGAAGAQAGRAGAPAADAAPDRIDYLTFAQGAVPVSIGGTGSKAGAGFEHAVRATDGDPTPFTVVNGASADAETEFVYELPALTTFDRLAVPNVVETPSPSATFTRTVEVHGSTTSASEGFALLASATLRTHAARGQVTELTMAATRPVRWVKLRLAGGIDVMRPQSSFEFSEIIGNGTQATPELSPAFTGAWRAQANRIRLIQKGPIVSGCYDSSGELAGTVTGNILRATGISRADKTTSQFILSVAADGSLRGVRSSNGAPFRLFNVAPAPAGTRVECAEPAPPALGCGSVIHGITFAFDSAEIRADSAGVLGELFRGLAADRSATILIEGHTSSEGSDEYNQRLSERRAQAVVADLVRRGIAASRLSAAGIGERRPLAGNQDEAGRSLNRRVEVKCR